MSYISFDSFGDVSNTVGETNGVCCIFGGIFFIENKLPLKALREIFFTKICFMIKYLSLFILFNI